MSGEDASHASLESSHASDESLEASTDEDYASSVFEESLDSDHYKLSVEQDMVCPDMTFRVIRRLGYGAFGAVWEMLHEDFAQPLAVKVGRAEAECNQEITILRRLMQDEHASEHICCLRIHTQTTSRRRLPRNHQVMAFDLYDMDLRTLLRDEGPDLSFPTIHKMTKQIASIVAWIHGHQVVHGDLKPENFLCKRSEGSFELRLTDFGAAIVAGDKCPHGGCTMAYRSPEQVFKQGQRYLTPASDVWAVGCVFMELYCDGDILFDATEHDEFEWEYHSASTDDSSSYLNTYHLGLMCDVLGSFPIRTARQHRDFFTARGKLRDYDVAQQGSRSVQSILVGTRHFDIVKATVCSTLISSMLRYNPKRRCTAEAILQHEWFQRKNT